MSASTLMLLTPKMLTNIKFMPLPILLLSFLFFWSQPGTSYLILSNSSYLDWINLPIIMMSIWVLLLTSSITELFKKLHPNMMLNLILFTLMIIMMTVTSLNLVKFFIVFEMSILPLLVMIMIWGYQPERIQASNYLTIYTLLASMPFLFIIMTLWSENYHNNMLMMFTANITLPSYPALILMLSPFLVKSPMFLLHPWLTKAHVEAPTMGSMILAGVLLKLGGFGVMKLIIILKFYSKISKSIMSVAISGGLIASMILMSQNDIKSFIAISSVHHMALSLAAALTSYSSGMKAALVVMVAHGFSSPLLFMISGKLFEVFSTRILSSIKGIMTPLPLLSILALTGMLANIPVPPSIALIGEIMTIEVITHIFMPWFMALSMLLLFIGCLYNITIIILITQGQSFINPSTLNDKSDSKFIFLSMLFLAPLLLTTIKPDLSM